MAADNRGVYPVPSGGSFLHDQALLKRMLCIKFIGRPVAIINGPAFRFQAVFTPPTADALTGWLAGPEALRFALQPLKASNQPGQIAEIFNHGDTPHASQAYLPYGLKHCRPACVPSRLRRGLSSRCRTDRQMRPWKNSIRLPSMAIYVIFLNSCP